MNSLCGGSDKGSMLTKCNANGDQTWDMQFCLIIVLASGKRPDGLYLLLELI